MTNPEENQFLNNIIYYNDLNLNNDARRELALAAVRLNGYYGLAVIRQNGYPGGYPEDDVLYTYPFTELVDDCRQLR